MQLLSCLGRSKPALFPDLTSFRRTASCLLQQKWWPSERTTCDQRKKQCCSPSRGGFPSVLIATSLAISKKSTSLALCKQQQKDCVLDSVPTDFILKSKQSGSKGPFQTRISCNLQRCIIDSAQDKPANPFFKKSAKAYSMIFQPSHIPPCSQLPTSKYAVLLGRNDLRSSSNSSDSSFLW